MTKKKVIEKVIKLLALSQNNPNSNEANLAEKKASELMAEWDISMIETQKEEEGFTKEERVLGRIKIIGYDAILINAISIFNDVAYLTKKGLYGKKGANIFLGKKADIEGNDYMIDMIFAQRKAAWTTYRKAYKEKMGFNPTTPQLSDWMKNFAWGVSEKLDEIRRAKENIVTERGLVPVSNRKQALKEYQKKHFIKQGRGVKGTSSSDGYSEGKNVEIRRGVKSDSKGYIR